MRSVVYYIFLSLLGTVLCNESPLVESPAGQFQGHILKTRNGRDVLSFQGIPYALPPTGSLRFKDPVKKPKINSLFQATDDSKECYQPLFDITNIREFDEFKGSEDCLYLNVYIPKIENTREKLPVFVWIHGGGYFMASGAASYNGPEYLLDKDMILVTMNYRLGVLGFLSTGDKILPGNLGLKDQIMVLKWVKENIESFGGDSNSITIGGESAGAAAVTQLMHSKQAKGLFQRVIAQSGSIDSLWATKTKENARNTAKKLAKQSECPFDNEFISCLQQKSVNQLFLDANAIKDPIGIMTMDFVPVIEDESPDAVLTDSSIKEKSEVPLLIGLNSRESLTTLAFLPAKDPKYVRLSSINDEYKKILPVLNYYDTHPNAETIVEKLVQFYFGKDGITDESQEAFTDLMGDIMFNYPVISRAKKHKGQAYMYMLSYKGQVNSVPIPFIPQHLTQDVAHAEDLLFLFNFSFMPHGEMNRRDREMSDIIVDSWYNFIKYGDPTPQSKVWKESEGGKKYLDITNKGLMMKSNMFDERIKFLDTLDLDIRTSLQHDEL